MKKVSNSPIKWIKQFPFKKKNSHKYSRGQLIVVGGQKNMIGATILSCEAALRTGVGSVKILCDKKTLPIYSMKFPSLLKEEINSFNKFKKFVNNNKKAVYLIGPGAGSSAQTKKKTDYILKKIKYVVIDADALTCFKNDQKKLYRLLDSSKIITPHVKEFKTIFPKLKNENNNNKAIEKAVKQVNCTIVLKSNISYIANKDFLSVNDKSTKELAVIGSGDVLAGLISSLVGEKKLNPFMASCAGVWMHSEIGNKSGTAIISEDLIKNIKSTLKKMYARFVE